MEGQRPVQAEDARDPRGLHCRGPTATTPRRGRASRLGNTQVSLASLAGSDELERMATDWVCRYPFRRSRATH